MEPISIDLSYLKYPKDMEGAVNTAIFSSIQTTINVVRDRWQQQAQNKLNSTRTDYLLGLNFDALKYPYENDPYAGAVVLQGKFPRMLEKGFPAFDMKQGFSQSKKKVITKNGWFLTIPIRHSTPNSFMYGNPMPKNIYKEAKKLPHWGSLRVKGGIKTSWTGYRHKANIYDGLTRIIKSYSNSKQSQYLTFRRVSSNSDPLSWWHPGFKGVNIADSLQGFTRETFRKTLEVTINEVLTGG